LIVAFVLGAATPFNPAVGRSGFSELFDLFIVPSFLGAPDRELIFGIVLCLELDVLRSNQSPNRQIKVILSTHVWGIYFDSLCKDGFRWRRDRMNAIEKSKVASLLLSWNLQEIEETRDNCFW
jgi:hypothetical protein